MIREASVAGQPSSEHDVPSPLERVNRFNRTERSVHWIQATSFLILLFTGFALAYPQLESLIGHRALLREIHLSSAFLFFFGPAIVALSGDRKAVARDVKAVDTWDADDFRWLLPGFMRRRLGNPDPPQGRFNAGQKLNALFVVWSTLTFTVTGLILWQNRRFPIELVSQSNTIHIALAYFALGAFLGHLYLATAYPKTRHAFRAITQGWVNREWAAHHHPKWLERIEPELPPPPWDTLRTVLQIALGTAVVLFLTRVMFFALGANVTDKVTGWLYAASAWPGTASLHPQTATHLFDGVGLVYGMACLLAWLALDRLRFAGVAGRAR